MKDCVISAQPCYNTTVESAQQAVLHKGCGGFCISNVAAGYVCLRNKNYNQLIKNLEINSTFSLHGSRWPDKNRYGTDFYICIPKSEIGIGLGKTHEKDGKKFHGVPGPYFADRALPPDGTRTRIESGSVSETYLPGEVYCSNCIDITLGLGDPLPGVMFKEMVALGLADQAHVAAMTRKIADKRFTEEYYIKMWMPQITEARKTEAACGMIESGSVRETYLPGEVYCFNCIDITNDANFTSMKIYQCMGH
jgi:hypothetical protein